MTFGITAFIVITFGITAFIMMTYSITHLCNDSQQNDIQDKTYSIIISSDATLVK